MAKKILHFICTENGYTAIFRTDHGRRVLLTLQQYDGGYIIKECRYVDRTKLAFPKKATRDEIPSDQLLTFVEDELDTTAEDYVFCNESAVSTLELIQSEISYDKPKILIFLEEAGYLRTVFKNRFRRSIQLTLKRDSNKTLLESCYYVDKRDAGNHRIPHTLVSIECGPSIKEILAFVNDELEGGFTHILIAGEHNIEFTENVPICDAI